VSDTDGKIVWFEVASADGGRARAFYGDLFGWAFQPFEDGGDYQMTDGGAVYSNPDGKGILVYFGTSDLDASVVQVRELGGQAGDRMRSQTWDATRPCSDTEGNAFGLYQQGWQIDGGRRAAARVGLISARPDMVSG
jgi:predicted enzyme related to lactoylglutathione lyase